MRIKIIDPNPELSEKYKKLTIRFIVLLSISISIGLIFGFNWLLN